MKNDEWLRVSETLPPAGEPVLCWTPEGCYVAALTPRGNWQLTETGSYAIDSQPDADPIHWRKLPEPPKCTQ